MGRKENIAVFFGGSTASFIPAKVGEVFKSFPVKQRCTIPMGRTAPMVFTERFTDFVALEEMGEGSRP